MFVRKAAGPLFKFPISTETRPHLSRRKTTYAIGWNWTLFRQGSSDQTLWTKPADPSLPAAPREQTSPTQHERRLKVLHDQFPPMEQQHQPTDIPPVPPVPEHSHQGSNVSQQPPIQDSNDPNRPIPYRASRALPKQSTLANLKAAATGIHGAGETLRGTINDTLDRRNPSAHAKNQAVIEKGRGEMQAARARQYANQVSVSQPYAEQGMSGGAMRVSQVAEVMGTGKTPYVRPPVSGAQVEGASGLGRGGKLSGIMKKMRDGTMASKEGTVGHS